MFSALTGAFDAAKGITKLLKSANDIKTTAEINTIKIEMQSLVIELQTNLMEVQQDFNTIQDEVKKYKDQLDEIRKFQSEKDQYSLFKLPTEATIYRATDNSHDLCPRCFDAHKKSVLQPKGIQNSYKIFECFNCNSSICYEHIEELVEIAPIQSRWRDFP